MKLKLENILRFNPATGAFEETLPLCALHHREGQFSQHAMGKQFWKHYDLDCDELLASYQAKYDAEHLGVLNPLEVIGAL